MAITPTDSTEVSSIIFSLNQDKSDGPNSVPTKILKLLNKDISDLVKIFFNQSFSSGIFPSILKTSEIILIYKKDSKLECSNYRSISLLSNIDKILERLSNVLEKKEIIFSLQISFRWYDIDKGNYACEISVAFQRPRTVDYHILLKKTRIL